MTTPSSTRGVVFIHSTPAALCPHISWALESVLGQRVSLEWTAQPLGRKLVRAEFSWLGPAGTGARLASALRGWDDVRYEVTEEPSTVPLAAHPDPWHPPHLDLRRR